MLKLLIQLVGNKEYLYTPLSSSLLWDINRGSAPLLYGRELSYVYVSSIIVTTHLLERRSVRKRMSSYSFVYFIV